MILRTKKERERVAREARQWGYLKYGNKLAVTCPLCQKRVETEADYRKSNERSLHEAMLWHLDDDHSPRSNPVDHDLRVLMRAALTDRDDLEAWEQLIQTARRRGVRLVALSRISGAAFLFDGVRVIDYGMLGDAITYVTYRHMPVMPTWRVERIALEGEIPHEDP